jgi:uncharacterized repeat protein (TIGR03803 family)
MLRVSTSIALGLVFVALMFAAPPAAPAQTLTVVHSFACCSQGYLPLAGLTADKAGNFYGTTSFGGLGSQCCGTVFKLTHKGSGWVFNPLYSFVAGNNSGAFPAARVIIGPDGSLYGTTMNGGPGTHCNSIDGCGTVFKLSPPPTACKTALCGWNESVLYGFTGAGDGGEPGYGDLVFDQAGSLYGTTITGGVGKCNSPVETCGLVFKLTPSNGGWTESVLYTFQGGSSDGGSPYAGVIFDQVGNLYGTTALGGQYGYGTVYQLTPSGSGWVENILYAFHGGEDGINPTGGLIFDQSGNLYGTTSAGGQGGGGTVFMLKPSNGDWTFSVAVSFTGTGSSPGPSDSLIMDAAGDLYGTTAVAGAYGFGSIFKLIPSNGGWTETDLHDFTCDAGCYPHGSVISDANGNLYGTTELGGAGNGGVVFELTQ